MLNSNSNYKWVDTYYRHFYIDVKTEEVIAAIRSTSWPCEDKTNLEVHSWGEDVFEKIEYLNLDCLKDIVEGHFS